MLQRDWALGDMSLLKQIIEVKELIPQESIGGTIRPPIFPQDRIVIDDITYRVNFLCKKLDGNYEFTATKL